MGGTYHRPSGRADPGARGLPQGALAPRGLSPPSGPGTAPIGIKPEAVPVDQEPTCAPLLRT